jgi:hypothetical protein
MGIFQTVINSIPFVTWNDKSQVDATPDQIIEQGFFWLKAGVVVVGLVAAAMILDDVEDILD